MRPHRARPRCDDPDRVWVGSIALQQTLREGHVCVAGILPQYNSDAAASAGGYRIRQLFSNYTAAPMKWEYA